MSYRFHWYHFCLHTAYWLIFITFFRRKDELKTAIMVLFQEFFYGIFFFKKNSDISEDSDGQGPRCLWAFVTWCQLTAQILSPHHYHAIHLWCHEGITSFRCRKSTVNVQKVVIYPNKCLHSSPYCSLSFSSSLKILQKSPQSTQNHILSTVIQ